MQCPEQDIISLSQDICRRKEETARDVSAIIFLISLNN